MSPSRRSRRRFRINRSPRRRYDRSSARPTTISAIPRLAVRQRERALELRIGRARPGSPRHAQISRPASPWPTGPPASTTGRSRCSSGRSTAQSARLGRRPSRYAHQPERPRARSTRPPASSIGRSRCWNGRLTARSGRPRRRPSRYAHRARAILANAYRVAGQFATCPASERADGGGPDGQAGRRPSRHDSPAGTPSRIVYRDLGRE